MLVRHADELVELMTKAARDSCREPGCLRYDVLRDRHNPKSFLFYEVYASEEDFEHHKRLPHTKNWGKFKFRDFALEVRLRGCHGVLDLALEGLVGFARGVQVHRVQPGGEEGGGKHSNFNF